MRKVVLSEFENTVQAVMNEKKKLAQIKGEPFRGIDGTDVLNSVRDRLGAEWTLTENQPVKFTKEDVNAVANSRFFRRTGLTLLLIWAFVVAVSAMFTTTVPIIPPYIYYIVLAVTSVIFLRLYMVKLGKIKRELRESLGIDANG